MNLNFNFKLKDLNGKSIEGDNGNAGKILGQMLFSQNKGNSLKLHDWALKVFNNKPIDLDDTDTNVLYGLIEQSEWLLVASKAPMLSYIDSVKDKEKKK